MAEETPERKEQERLLRAMTKGPRGAVAAANARPVSWNVHLSGRAVAGPASKKEQDEALRLLQEQVKDEAFKVAVTNASTAEQPYQKKSPPITPPRDPIASPSPTLEEQAEINAFNAFNEQRELERINKWTRGTGGKLDPAETKKPDTHFERPVPAVLIRQVDVESTHHHHTKPVEHNNHPSEEKLSINTEFHNELPKFTTNITVAAKALKQQNSEALISASFSVVVIAKILAGMIHEDTEIISWAKALEGATNELRTIVDGGRSGREHYNELSNALGQLYLSVVGLE